MPNKRSRRKDTQKFLCPCCQGRLWRVGGTKYHLFYQGKSEIQKALNLTNKKASFLASQRPTYVDTNVWLEEFCCQQDGSMWMRVSKSVNNQLIAHVATCEDWQRTTKTIDPNRPNCSVSEFTYRMSHPK